MTLVFTDTGGTLGKGGFGLNVSKFRDENKSGSLADGKVVFIDGNITFDVPGVFEGLPIMLLVPGVIVDESKLPLAGAF